MPRWIAESISSGVGGAIFGGFGPVMAWGEIWSEALVEAPLPVEVAADFSESVSDAARVGIVATSAISAAAANGRDCDMRVLIIVRSAESFALMRHAAARP